MYDRAESYCLKALSYFPQHKELLNDWVRLLALQHLSNEQVAERLRAFEQIIRLDRAPTLLHLSKCLYREGYVLQAADYFLQLLSSDYLDAEGLYFLSEIVYRRKGYIQAADLFERVLELEPRLTRASLGVALCYMRLGKQTLLEGLEKNPNHPSRNESMRRSLFFRLIQTSII